MHGRGPKQTRRASLRTEANGDTEPGGRDRLRETSDAPSPRLAPAAGGHRPIREAARA